ncbi:unnamed protein product [Malassezia sympodialis ATCC 42132]|uniref:uncharacterized protein n=1 Tax=Malassezia sympodialis (strain ATCC 42132) TaxID=1230383 RepID=UPI0002C1D89D|nr:uncharacterized protein MSY001_3488 [Malassezia sympodialis ATCC 42132]CCV00782.1 unnamed protein product [Malassezia sympodialis ATCC 42132]|eukprot:XP_018741955.1 uncharacterized protein MSY001_3488 [Malassezia sympodialis ATCC 42132]
MRRRESARARADDEDGSSSPSALPEEDEDLRSDFLADFDEQTFLAQLDLLNPRGPPAPPGATAAPIAEAPPPVAPAGHGAYAPPSSDFYGTAIQILTHILGSSTPYPWLADGHTPRADDGPPPWDPLHFADLTFPEDEDDDPDFLPLSHEADELGAPSASAWSRAMDEVVPTRAKRRDAAAASPTKPKRGRPRQYTAEEAMARKRGRNRDYMARQREKKQGEAPSLPPAPAPAPAPAAAPDERLVLEAENRFLRTELERLREENARLRGREEMRAYAARLGLDPRAHEAMS